MLELDDVPGPTVGREWRQQVLLSRICVALDDLSSKSCSTGLTVCVAPLKQKGVFASHECKKGLLRLVPLTPNVRITHQSEPVAQGAINLGPIFSTNGTNGNGNIGMIKFNVILVSKITLPSKPDSTTGHIARASSAPFVVPFWFVREADKTKNEEPNMEVHMHSTAGELNDLIINIPVLTNARAIAIDEELIRPPWVTVEDTEAPPAKRPKATQPRSDSSMAVRAGGSAKATAGAGRGSKPVPKKQVTRHR